MHEASRESVRDIQVAGLRIVPGPKSINACCVAKLNTDMKVISLHF